MSNKHVIESVLRPAVELNSAIAAAVSGGLCIAAPWSLALSNDVGIGMATGFAVFSIIRAQQGFRILAIRRNIRRLPYYSMTSEQIPVSNRYLFLGKGFLWEQKHTQRLVTCRRPEVQKYVKQPGYYQFARRIEKASEMKMPWLAKMLSKDSVFNPVRPLPPVGGSPLIHGIEINEIDVNLPLGERVGHTIVFGTTRVGKTREAEILISQDIARGEVVIVFDPKGDADLLQRCYAECKRTGRLDEFYVFHLGWPEISARYNAIGRFDRISEVANRISGQLPSEGNSAAFREFAWRFVNIISRALVSLGRRPDYLQIQQHVVNIDALFLEYAKKYFDENHPNVWKTILEASAQINEKNLSFAQKDKNKTVIALEQYIIANKIYDPILNGLLSAVRYDKTYFDKLVASLLPLLEKLTTGKTAELLAPNYSDLSDPRPIFDWQQIIRKNGVVYIGLDALSDTAVAAAVGNSMFSDLVSIAGYLYKHGINDGLPGQDKIKRVINLHCDEFNELMGDEFIPLVNKGGGAGIQVTAYTQTLSDIEARLGNAAKARQVIGNFNNLIMLRVREPETAKLLTDQLHEVDILKNTVISGVTDSSDPTSNTDFTSNTQDRVSSETTAMIDPSTVIQLPKGQAFALIEGGQLWKVRMPLPGAIKDEHMPKDLQQLCKLMKERYRTGESWWTDDSYQVSDLTDIQKEALKSLELNKNNDDDRMNNGIGNE